MPNSFYQHQWDDATEAACRAIVRIAVLEDLDRLQDWTTVALVPAEAKAKATIIARESGTIAGLRAVEVLLDEMSAKVCCEAHREDGATVPKGEPLATLVGNARDILVCERPILNLLSRLSGVATLAARYVKAARDTSVTILDTRKTTPGWRRLEKYAVRCGGASNHRTGLYDAVMIKDNHLAFWNAEHSKQEKNLQEAIEVVRNFLKSDRTPKQSRAIPVEIEVDTLKQLAMVLPAKPDIVLLDNMGPEQLLKAVSMRDKNAPDVVLEASGGVNLDTVREIAETGVDRISVGALTHSAGCLDIALDWNAA